MLGAVAGLASREGVEVRGFEAAGVSYPGFARDLDSLTPEPEGNSFGTCGAYEVRELAPTGCSSELRCRIVGKGDVGIRDQQVVPVAIVADREDIERAEVAGRPRSTTQLAA